MRIIMSCELNLKSWGLLILTLNVKRNKKIKMKQPKSWQQCDRIWAIIPTTCQQSVFRLN